MGVDIRIGDCRETLAYCAGVIDSDGTIGIKRNTYSMRKVGDCQQASYSARICVRQVSVEALNVLSATFGGNVRPARTYAKRGKPMWSWEIRDAKAGDALTRLLPFLKIKKAQAENCLELRRTIAKSKAARVAVGRGHVGAAKRPAEITEHLEALKARASLLNRVGV